MSQIDAVLFPKDSLNPDQLKEFGQAIMDWCEGEQGTNVPVFFDPGPVDDLFNGELPKPFVQRAIETEEWESKPYRRILEEKGESASGRFVRIWTTARDITVDDFIHRLKLYIPSDLVERVVIDGDSFTL